jgi:Protein of unknown function (DUF4019)
VGRVVARCPQPLGKPLSHQLKKAQHTKAVPGAPDGDYVVMQFDTRFEHKHAAVETVTFMQEKHGTWKAAGYYIGQLPFPVLGLDQSEEAISTNHSESWK